MPKRSASVCVRDAMARSFPVLEPASPLAKTEAMRPVEMMPQLIIVRSLRFEKVERGIIEFWSAVRNGDSNTKCTKDTKDHKEVSLSGAPLVVAGEGLWELGRDGFGEFFGEFDG